MLFCSWTHPRVALTVSVTDIRDTLVVLSNRRKHFPVGRKKSVGNSEFETIKTCSAVANPWLDPYCSRSRFHYFLCVSSLLEKWLKLNKGDVVWYQRVSACCPQDLYDVVLLHLAVCTSGSDWTRFVGSVQTSVRPLSQRESESRKSSSNLMMSLPPGGFCCVLRPGGDAAESSWSIKKTKIEAAAASSSSSFLLLTDEKEKSLVLELLSVFNFSAVCHSERKKACVCSVSRLFAPICN